MLQIFASVLFISSLSGAAPFTSEGMKIDTEKVFSGKDVIWSIEFLNPNLVMFTEKGGKIKLLDLTTKKVSDVTGAP